MEADTGKNELRTLVGGEVVYLLKAPGEKWRIRMYDVWEGIRSDGKVFQWVDGLPAGWRNREFDTGDDAVSFAQEEIDKGRVPRNRRKDAGRA